MFGHIVLKLLTVEARIADDGTGPTNAQPFRYHNWDRSHNQVTYRQTQHR